jgi:phage minor structural protein
MQIELYNLNSEKILHLRSSTFSTIPGEVYNIQLEENVNSVCELKFIIPYQICVDGITEDNFRLQYIKNEMKVKLITDSNQIMWFRIKSQLEEHSESGILLSNVQCKSLAYDLTKRNINVTYDESVDNATNLMTLVLVNSGWTLGTVDVSLDAKFRTLRISSKSNALSHLQTVSELFMAYLEFDTDNKTVGLRTSLGSSNGVNFRYSKNLRNIQYESSSDELVSKLYAIGGEDDSGSITFESENSLKTNYILDFSYFVSAGLMNTATQNLVTTFNGDIASAVTNINNTQVLIDAENASIASKQTVVNIKKIRIQSLNQLVSENNAKLALYATGSADNISIQAELTKFNNRISRLTTGGTFTATYQVHVSSGSLIVSGATGSLFIADELMSLDNITVNSQIREVNTVTSNLSLSVASAFTTTGTYDLLVDITGYLELNSEIAAHQASAAAQTVNLNNYITAKNNIENQFYTDLSEYIFEGNFQDSSYLTASGLYTDSVELLAELAYPRATYRLSLVDLSSLTDYSIEKFELGDEIRVTDDVLGVDLNVNISKISRILDMPWKTTVEISNYTSQFENLLKSLSQSSNVVYNKQDAWNRTENAITSSGSISVTSMQNTFTDNVFDFTNGTNNSIEITSGGIISTNIKDSRYKSKMDGGNISYSTDSGSSWLTIFTMYPDDDDVKVGFNVDYLRGGAIDASQISIKGGSDNSGFFWNKYALYAKESNLKYIKLNQDGIISTTDDGTITNFNLAASGSLTLSGDMILPQAGVLNTGSEATSVRFFAGTGVTGASNASFRVLQDGTVLASNLIASGAIVASTGSIGGWQITTSTLQNGTNALLDSANYNVSFDSSGAVYGQFATAKYGMAVNEFIVNGTDNQIYVGTSYTSSNFKIDLSNGEFISVDATIGTIQDQNYYIKNTHSYYETNLTGSDNDLYYTSKVSGTNGDNINICYVSGASTSVTTASLLGVGTAADPYLVTVSLSCTAAINANAWNVVSSIVASTVCNTILLADVASGNSGTGIVTLLATAQLSSWSQGSDSNDGLTTGAAFLSIQHALDILPKYINNTINIYLERGYYDEELLIENFNGVGSIYIYGGNLNSSVKYKIGYIEGNNCSPQINFIGINLANKNATSHVSAYITNCSLVVFTGISSYLKSISNLLTAIRYDKSKGIVNSSIIKYKEYGIWASNLSLVSLDAYNSGDNNTFNYYSESGSFISVAPWGTAIEGTPTSTKESGGFINDNWASWTPTLTWTTATPASITTLAKYKCMGNICYFSIYITSSDGNGATNLTITLPVYTEPDDSYVSFSAQQLVNTTWANRIAYTNCSAADSYYIRFRDFATCTDGQTVSVIVSGFYEVFDGIL